ncbi:MAG: cyclase family protein [Desulfobacteraceae bacterium]|nr:cyclase family protein [Desulfobacteraceae bacterium]
MNIIDLTHVISPDMPVYPGTEPPVFITGCSIDKTGFLEKKITFHSHTGTHIDAPAHLIKNAKTLDMLPIEQFYGKALLLNTDHMQSRTIGLKELKPHESIISQVDFLIIYTGWSRYWGDDKYFSNYPVLSLKAAQWLGNFNLKGLGLDTISADTVDTQNYPVHKTFLQNDTIIIENLKHLNKLPYNQFAFSCFPLNFEKADGSPVRAVAYI